MEQKELRDLENRCIQELAPACTAACPIHVDARGMLAEISQGDYTAGLKILRKSLPFPGIISRICDQPCQPACKRGEIGDPIQIANLEAACVEWGGPREPLVPLPRKPKRVAVIGGGLSGLTVAYDLRRKGYEIVIYEAGDRLGGSLWDYPPERLPRRVILEDFQVVDQLGVEVIFNTPVGKVGTNGRFPPLSLLCEEYEAIYVGAGAKSHDLYDLNLNDQGQVQVDPVTFMTSHDGIFAGGGFLSVTIGPHPRDRRSDSEIRPVDSTQSDFVKMADPGRDRSPILAISQGRRAATSIDRYLQRVSLTAARTNEGSYTTRLFTSTQGIEVKSTVLHGIPGENFSRDEAMLEAQRCIQCQCLECVKVCEFLKQYNGYPKKYIREVYNNLSIVMGTRYSNKFINSCSLCGLCGEVCPEDLQMGAVCKEARQTMVQQKRMPASAHDFALRDMAFSNSGKFSMAYHQPGKSSSEYVFFPGCQLSAAEPGYVEKVYTYLQQRLPVTRPGEAGVGLILRCCGAPADWAGREDLFHASQEELLADYESLGRPKVILACSSCYQVFKTSYPSVAISSLWEVMEDLGLPDDIQVKSGQRLPGPLAIHDPCSTRYESQIQDSVRRIIQRLGYEVEELPLNREKTECCSYGGLMWLAHPELAEKVVQRRIKESQADYITYCAMCRDFFARQGKPTLHLLDLIYGGDLPGRANHAGPGYSQRHENRARLKRTLLKKYWGEDMDDQQAYERIQLILADEVSETLEKRQILVEDIQQVIEYAERTGKRMYNSSTGHYLAYYKPTSVTYWVEYIPQGEAFIIHKAYCHRMEIGAGASK